MDPNAGDRIGQNYQDWIDFFRRGASGFNPGAFIQGLMPKPAPVTAPEPAAPAPAPEAPPAAAPAPAEPAKTPSTLEEFRTQLQEAKTALAAAEAVAKDDNQPPDVRVRAQATATTLRGGITTITTQIAAEENRVRDEAAAAKKAEEDKAEKKRLEDKADAKVADAAPKNGDERWVPIETTDEQGRKVRGVGQEIYTNGVWKYQKGSAVADTGFGSGPQGPGTPRNLSLQKDGKGNYYTFDPATGKIEKVSGLAGTGEQFSVVTLSDGTSWLAGPDGKPREKLTDAKPTSNVVDNFLVLTDPETGKSITRVDLLDPAQRDRANTLANLAVEQGQLALKAGEQALQPKFTDAGAQYTQEAQRRQAMARQELERLTKLQQEGQISPDQAEAQFDAWMKVNVEGPLSGYKRAADEERRVREQENLDRETAEQTRVDALNRQRDTMAFQAGEAGRQEGIDIGRQTRAPEFISDLGGLANSLASGRTDFKFSPGSFDVANYRKVVPNLNELADAAINRLFARVPAAAARGGLSVPLTPPVGDDLRASMDSVRYSGPMSNAPPGEQPLQGQGALDQGNGMARSVYSNGRYVDWAIPQTPPAGGPTPAAAPTAPTAPALPGQLPGETPEQREARWAAIMGR